MTDNISHSQIAPAPQEEASPWKHLAIGAVLLLVFSPLVYRFAWPEQTASAQASQDILTIHYMAWGNPQQLETEREVTRRFNIKCIAEQKPLRVELSMPPAGGYTQKLLMMLASGAAPDVARVDHYNFASMAAKGYFRDLTDIAASDPTYSSADFHPSALRENYYRGRLYAQSMLFGGLIIYYNKDLFRHAGLADPYQLWKQGKWTWAAFEDTAARLTTHDAAGRPIIFGCQFYTGNGPPVANWGLWLWRNHADFMSPDDSRCTLDSPAALTAITQMRGLAYDSKVCPTPANSGSNAFVFEGGNIAMFIDYCGNCPRYRDSIRDFQWDIAPTPSDPDNQYTLSKGNQVVITTQCQHPREAWEWVKYLTSRETESYFYGDEYRRCVPTRLSVLHSPAFLNASRPPFHIDVFVDVLDRARELPIDEAWGTWTTTALRYMEKLFIDPNADLTQTLQQCTAAVNIDLQREHERFQRYARQVPDAQ